MNVKVMDGMRVRWSGEPERGSERARRASRSFFEVEAALVEEEAKRRLGMKLRLAAKRRLVARAEADGEPNRAVKRLLNAAQFLPAAQRRLAAKRVL